MKRLYRLDRGVLAGVCGGVAEFFGIDSNIVRLIWAVIACTGIGSGFAIILYVLAALILPKKSEIYPGY